MQKIFSVSNHWLKEVNEFLETNKEAKVVQIHNGHIDDRDGIKTFYDYVVVEYGEE